MAVPATSEAWEEFYDALAYYRDTQLERLWNLSFEPEPVYHWRKPKPSLHPDMAQMLDDIERNFPRRIVQPDLTIYRLSYSDIIETEKVLL